MAARLYAPAPPEEELKKLGLLAEDVMDNSPIDVWPANELAVHVFLAMRTQWRVGAGGATGFDYGVLPIVLKNLGVCKKERPSVFNDLQVMEIEALNQMSRK